MPPTAESVVDIPYVKGLVAAVEAVLAEIANLPSLAIKSVVACPTTAEKIKVPICGMDMPMNSLKCDLTKKVLLLQPGQVSTWALRQWNM
mmetsp:Transcript_34434/g.73337  ORF Transcript_34434/g.73337 Transcript_34434/m.73337 type:complete len:90 (-) Transcript_34434:365-634(-)